MPGMEGSEHQQPVTAKKQKKKNHQRKQPRISTGQALPEPQAINDDKSKKRKTRRRRRRRKTTRRNYITRELKKRRVAETYAPATYLNLAVCCS